MKSIDRSAVHAVCVTYRPEKGELSRLVHALSPQVDRIHMIDNTPAGEAWLSGWLSGAGIPNVELIELGSNKGIATAQNVGIQMAVKAGATHVLLSDQDSMPESRMVAELLAVFQSETSNNRSIAAVGPAYVDRRIGSLVPFEVVNRSRCFHRSPPLMLDGPHVEVITMISSGTLMSCEAIRHVGLMMDELFIDHVDTEWCFRATSRGYAILCTPKARLSHRLGDRSFRVWTGRWRNYTDYGPRRLYYRYRNFIVLCKLPYVDGCWKLRSGWNWLGDMYAHLFFSRNKLAKCRAIMRGLCHGLLGRLGPMPDGS